MKQSLRAAALLMLCWPGYFAIADDVGCIWSPSEPSDECDLVQTDIDRNVMDPPEAHPTTVSRDVDDFSPSLLHENDSCTPTTDTFAVDFEVQQTETFSVQTTTTVAIATELKTKAEVYSVAEAETGIKTEVTQSLAFGFSLEATVINRSQSSILQEVPPKNRFEVLPAVTIRDYIITMRSFDTVRTYRVSDCSPGSPSYEAVKSCGIRDDVAYASVVNGGANYTTRLTQFETCSGDSDTDNDGIPDTEDPDIDGDGWANEHDDDTDNDGVPNDQDDDIDGDGISNDQDDSDWGPFQTDDIDGDGTPNHEDDDMDDDGTANEDDDDIDGDGVLNDEDPDADGDGVEDENDLSPWGWLLELIRRILELFRLV